VSAHAVSAVGPFAAPVVSVAARVVSVAAESVGAVESGAAVVAAAVVSAGFAVSVVEHAATRVLAATNAHTTLSDFFT
jgi:hypothetical protein